MNKLKEDSEMYRLWLLTGYAKIEDVIKWADEIIEKLDSPPHEIIEVSLASGIPDIISKLQEVKGEFDFNKVFKRFLGMLYQHLSANSSDAKHIAHWLYNFMFECKHELPSEIEEYIYYFDDGFDLAVLGYYENLEDLTKEFKEFLFKHSM